MRISVNRELKVIQFWVSNEENRVKILWRKYAGLPPCFRIVKSLNE